MLRYFPPLYVGLEVSMQHEVTVWRLIIVPLERWNNNLKNQILFRKKLSAV
jgi:hypothetical protein